MTEAQRINLSADPLPGLEAPGVPVTKLEAACRRTIDAVSTAGLLTERDAAACELTLVLSRAVDAGVRSGRASAAAMAARELRETLLMLPQPEATPAGAEWQQLVDKLIDAGDGRQP